MTAGHLERVSVRNPRDRRSVRRRRAWRNAFSGVLYLAPALAVFTMFLFCPAVAMGWLSTFASNARGVPTKFIGLDAYIAHLSSEGFRSSLWATLLFILMVVPATMVVALALAILANEKIRGIGFFRTVYAMPLAISSAAAAVVWRLIFHPSQGILNTNLGAIGRPT